MPRTMQHLLDQLVTESRRILNTKFVGLYLHGSLAMGCFNPEASDVDFLIVVDQELSDDEAHALLATFVRLNEAAPPKGLELSVVQQSVLKPFSYPTPHELHFSPDHLAYYHEDPSHYVEHRRGNDPDLAAHITILHSYGKACSGPPITTVFGEVPPEAYIDSILLDQADPEKAILEDPTYTVLNLCRVLAYVKENLILSKAGGAQWGLENLPESIHPVISSALRHYVDGIPIELGQDVLIQFAAHMKVKIQEALSTKKADLTIGEDHPGTEELRRFLYLAIYVPEGNTAPAPEILDTAELQIYVEDFGRHDGDLAVGARIGNRLIGLAWVRNMEDYGYLNAETPSLAISVDPLWRSRGIGRRLMQTLFSLLHEKDVTGLSLSVQKSSKAVEFYESLGFTRVQERAEDYLMYRAL